MKAVDVMVPNVITVGANATVAEAAAILLNNHISGAPVVGGKGELIGIVSEGDLIRRPETGTARRPSWWLSLLASERTLAIEYLKSHSRNVADVMTRDGITADPTRRLATSQPSWSGTASSVSLLLRAVSSSASSAEPTSYRRWRAPPGSCRRLRMSMTRNCANE